MALPFGRSPDFEDSSLAQDAEEHWQPACAFARRSEELGAASAGGVNLRPKTVESEAPAALSGSLIKPPALPVVLTSQIPARPKSHPIRTAYRAHMDFKGHSLLARFLWRNLLPEDAARFSGRHLQVGREATPEWRTL